MLELRDQGALIDFTILVEEYVFSAHKVVLAASSDYFRTMFLHDATKEVRESSVRLEDISVSATKAIIDFCYTSEIVLNDDNVQEIIWAASRLQVNQILDLASRFVIERIGNSNCLGIYSMAKLLQLPILLHDALNYCLRNFASLVDEQEFSEVDHSSLEDLISNNQLDMDDEELVLNAIIKWARVDIEERKSKLKDLMYHVRFSTIEPLGLINLASEPILQDQPACLKYIDEAKNFILLKDRPEIRAQLGLQGQRFSVRDSLRRRQRIYAIGGWTNEYRPTKRAEIYDPYNDTWTEVSSMSVPRCGVGAVICNDFLYAVGGFDGNMHLRSVERYDIIADKWYKDVADLKFERTSVGLVTLNDRIYAIGGQVGTNVSNLVERYDRVSNTWTECAPMNLRRLGAGIVTLNGYIYAIGGGGDTERELDSVERYDPKEDTWIPLKSMFCKRKHLACAVHDGKIYAIGGRGEEAETNFCECYDPKTDMWDTIPGLAKSRSGHGLVELDGQLFAIGGQCDKSRLKSVEVYDIKTATWSDRTSMSQERVGAGYAVYSRLKQSQMI